MPFVIDASMTLAWVMPDETDPAADIAYRRLRQDEAVAPNLWWYEVRNVLMANERRRRIDRLTIVEFLAVLERLPITVHHSPDEDALLGLAGTYRLTVYDAAYLELAIRRSLPLASLDRELLVAARSVGVACLGKT